MINYFNYEYPQPDVEDPFSVNTELASCPWNENPQAGAYWIAGGKNTY